MRPKQPHDAIVQSRSGPPYAGIAGRTRTERVHLVAADGSLHTLEVHRVVNVVSHPELKARVLAGQLHRFDDGRELAIPFVYHDPAHRKLALVVPSVLAHVEMKEWSRLMGEIADDTDHPVPEYVRDCTTVVGLGALEAFLESGVEPDDSELEEVRPSAREIAAAAAREHTERDRALAERDRLMAEREREVTEQEQSLMRLASDLTSRESSLLRREEQIATARADLEEREAELAVPRRRAPRAASEAREARAPNHAHDADVVPDGEWQEVRAAEVGARDEQPRDEPTVVAAVARVAGHASQQGAFSEPGLSEPPRSTQPPRSGRPSRSAGPPPLRARPASAPLAPRSASSAPPARKSEPPPAAPRVSSVPAAPRPIGATGTPLDPSRVRRSSSPPASDLSSADLAAVHAALRLPSRRAEALAEIGRRGDESSLSVVFGVIDELPDDLIAVAVARIAGFGERAGDGLIAGLGAPKPQVRQACAIALGRLKLRRGLAPLLEQLEAEPTAVWNEIARALGDYGLAALRSLARGLRASARRERLMIALAHLAHHGCGEDLESLEKDPDTVLALAAKQALARAPRLEWEDKAVRGGGALTEASPEARFSQTVYAALG